MRITNLTLKNFRCFPVAGLELGGRSLIVGENACGKSTIVDAVSFCLTGRCRGLDAGGKGADDLIRTGEAEASVRVRIEGIGDVKRTQNGKGQTLEIIQAPDKKTSASAQKIQAVLYEKLGVNESMILSVLEGSRILDLPHAEANALLMTILGVRVKPEDVAPTLVIEGPLSLEEVDERYNSAFAERAAAKKILQAIQIPTLPDEIPPPAEALEEKLKALRQEESQLVATRAEVVGRREVLLDQRQTLTAEIAEAETAVASLSEKRLALKALQRKLDALPKPDPKPQLQLVDAQGTLRLLQDALSSIESHDPKRGCVLDGRVPCVTDPKDFGKALKSVKRDLAEAQAVETAAQEAITAGQEAARERVALEGEVRIAERLIAAAEASRTPLQRLHDALTKVDGELAGLADEPGNGGAVDQALTVVRQRIAKGELVVREARRIHALVASHREAVSKRDAATAEVQRLETLCQLLGPKGVRAKVLAHALDGFHARLDTVLQGYGYQLRFETAPWRIAVNGRSAKLLSASERLRVGVAFSIALAELTGLRFVMIDQGDLLDKTNRGILAELLGSWDGQSVLLATRDEDYDPVLPAEIVGWRLLGDGKVERLRSERAA